MKIGKCTYCNSTSFLIIEKIVHEAESSESGKDLTAYKIFSHKIEKIICKKCNRIYKEENFKLINFY